MQRRLTSISIILMLIITNVAIAEESFLKAGNIPSLERDFQTAPDKFTFAIIGDKTGGGEENWHIFDRAMEEINLLNPDFAITIGDHIQGYTKDLVEVKKMWDEYYSHLSRLKMPVMLVPGNHDISYTEMYGYWKNNMGKTYYSFDYKDCHFIAINTEEHNSPEGASAFEKSLLDFMIKDIQQNKSAKHIFIFMHRPLWIEDTKFWEKVESELKDTNYSVFAGHYHHLTHDARNDHNYVILSATGGVLDERTDIPQLGLFHHYSIVSVSGKDANIAIIQPGKILPSTISTREYGERLHASMDQLKPEIPVPGVDGETYGKLTVTQTNKIDKLLRTKITMADANGWKATPKEMVLEVSPGETAQSAFELTYNADAISNPLKYNIERYYDSTLISKQDAQLSLMDIAKMRSIPEWTVGTFFNIPVATGKIDSEGKAFVYDYYNAKLGPEIDTGYKTEIKLSASDVSESQKQVVNLDKAYQLATNYVITYAQSFIYAPEDTVVWGALVADDIASVFVNNKQAGDTYKLKDMKGQYKFIPIALKPGWNSVIVKCADIEDDWYFGFRIDDAKSQLKFSTTPEE